MGIKLAIDSEQIDSDQVRKLVAVAESRKLAYAAVAAVMEKPVYESKHGALYATDIVALTCDTLQQLEVFFKKSSWDDPFSRDLFAAAEAVRRGETGNRLDRVVTDLMPEIEEKYGRGVEGARTRVSFLERARNAKKRHWISTEERQKKKCWISSEKRRRRRISKKQRWPSRCFFSLLCMTKRATGRLRPPTR